MKIRLIALTIALLLGITSFAQEIEINKTNLCKKWKLEKYEMFWIDYDLDPKEINDYILFKADNKFEGIDEGKQSRGDWELEEKDKKKYIVMSDGEGEIRLLVEELEKDHMVLIVDHEELFDLEIHFNAI